MHVVKTELMYVSKPFAGEGEKGLQRAQCAFLKKSSLRALRAHNVRTHYARTPVVHCLHKCTVPFMGLSSLGPQNMGDGSGGVEEGNGRRAKSACPPDDQSSPRRH